ncbi:MAG: D-aminoacyl-tRNA deacylase [Myxococcota bacterium]
MRVVLQRVKWARVIVGDEVVGEIERGLLILLGIARGDFEEMVLPMARKVAGLRIFADDADKMNLSLGDVGGGALVVSQFTLFADCRKGRRPYFGYSEAPERAAQLYQAFCQGLSEVGVHRVESGRFGAMMQVELCNDGPVTIILNSEDL